MAATETLSNFIQINDNNTVSGNIATLSFDVDVIGEPVNSSNEKAPVYRLFAQSPRGRRIDVGGIWKNENQKGQTYLTLTLNTGNGKFYANLGRYAGQDDPNLLAVIANDFLNSQRRG